MNRIFYVGRWITLVILCLVLGTLCGCSAKDDTVLFTASTENNLQDDGADTNVTVKAESADASVTTNSDDLRNGIDSGGEASGNDPESESAIFYVHICGAVNSPGVYEFEKGSRVFHAIESAGGFCEDADCDYINLAQPLSDGMKIIVPTLSQTAEAKENGPENENTSSEIGIVSQNEEDHTENSSNGKTNINLADKEELCGVSGIGPSKAEAIIKYREENGLFDSVEDITKVSGIGQGTFEKIREEITVDK